MRYFLLLPILVISVFFIYSCGTESTPTYTLSTSVVGEGTITPSGGTYEEGEVVTLTATPNEHWIFNNWSGDGSGTSTSISITMDSDKNVVGNFVEKEYSINYTINGSGSVDEEVIQSKSQYTVGTVVQLKPNPSTGWRFTEWPGWDGEVGVDDKIIVTVDGELTVAVTFERKDYPLTITIEGEGTVQERIVSSPKTTDYPFETVVELTPTPSDGWRFVEWSGDLSGDAKPIQITISSEKNVTVKFEPIVYLGENGITIMCPDGKVGDIGIVDGVEFEVVDNNLLRQRLEEGRGSLSRKVCVSLLTNMVNLFKGLNFNEPIEYWDVGNVTNMSFMFQESPFNHTIKDWDVSNVTTMSFMFFESDFNQPIKDWNVSKVTNMDRMFNDGQFNNPIGDWNVSNVTSMIGMFRNSPFNQPIGGWSVSNVTTMFGMFIDTPFNQSIGEWDVSNVTDMSFMFRGTPFNQNISGWCVWRIGSEPSGFSRNSPLTQQNKPKWGTCPD